MYKENTQTLRNSIKKFASDNHLTLTEIAKRAGIYLTSLSRLVSGKTKTVQLETLEKLKAIGVRVDLTSDFADGTAMSPKEHLRYRLCFELLSICRDTNDIQGVSAMMNKPEIADALEDFVINPPRTVAKLLLGLYRKQ
jgi:DNA-binding Xre family transcriptional regulator